MAWAWPCAYPGAVVSRVGGDASDEEAVERGHEPVEALGLKLLRNAPRFINVRFAGYACCSADKGLMERTS